MDKLKMAHDWFISSINNGKHVTIEQAWCYADAMQAEVDKRNKAEAEQKRKVVREMLNADNTFLEKEGQHFDDVCIDEMYAQRDAELYGHGFLKVTYSENGVKYERLNPMTVSLCAKNIGLDSDVLNEWQPDWSQAPEWAVAWAFDKNGATWWSEVPEIHENIWDGRVQAFANAPSFDYQGNWKDSLRKRPTNI